MGLGTFRRFFSVLSTDYVNLSSLHKEICDGVIRFEKQLGESLQGKKCASLNEMLRVLILKRKPFYLSKFFVERSTSKDGVAFESTSDNSIYGSGLVVSTVEQVLRDSEKRLVTPNRKEGLNFLYKASAILWLLLSHRYPSLRVDKTYYFIKEAMRRFRYRLSDLSDDPECLDYSSMLNRGYVKEKHWVYALYIATITSLPILYRVCDSNGILRAILAKTSFGSNVKLLDNLNDEIHDVSQAVHSLRNWLSAHTKGEYINRNEARDPIVTKAENSAFKIGTWVFRTVSSCRLRAPEMYRLYLKDAMKIVEGQADSIRHKADREGKLPSIGEYISYISEKSIGDLWIDIDLCFLESRLKGFEEERSTIELLKKGNSLVFKSCLFYDDVQDIYEDLRTKSINSAIILALERGVATFNDFKDKKPSEMVKRLAEAGILMDVIRLADLFFLAGIETLDKMESRLQGILDKQGLIQSYRLLRMFLLRKLLIVNRDYEAVKLFLSSLSDLQRIKRHIPEDIMELQRYLA